MIEVQGLRVVLPPDTVALYGVDLVVEPGEFVVIIGRSGAGKTTFLRAINRLVEPTAGTVRVAGQPVTGTDPGALASGAPADRHDLPAVQPRAARLRPRQRAGGPARLCPRVAEPRRTLSPRDRALARDCLAQVGLADFAARRADTLSGGEQQRVAIARALAQEPQVILGDEPTASLDPTLAGSIMGILGRINRERRLTLVVSQHQLETALEHGTRIVGFRAGHVVFDGPPAAVSPDVVQRIYGEEAA